MLQGDRGGLGALQAVRLMEGKEQHATLATFCSRLNLCPNTVD